MRIRNLVLVLGLGGALWNPERVLAQVPYPYTNNVAPTSRQVQPLSPYLNLLNGGDPAVNYFYGVRPAQLNPAFYGSRGNLIQSQPRIQQPTLTDPNQTNLPTKQGVMPTTGYSPSSTGNIAPQGLPATGHQTGFNTGLTFFAPFSTGRQPSNTAPPR